jgi:hypothetical protein
MVYDKSEKWIEKMKKLYPFYVVKLFEYHYYFIMSGCPFECKLFEHTIGFDEAREYTKSYGAYLRHNQWLDVTVEVWI